MWDSGDASGAFDLSLLVPAFLFCLLVLPLCRLLMVWVYDHTESVLLAVVMHASITGIVAMIVIPLDASGWPSLGGTWCLRRLCRLWPSPSTSSLFEGIGHDRRRQALPLGTRVDRVSPLKPPVRRRPDRRPIVAPGRTRGCQGRPGPGAC